MKMFRRFPKAGAGVSRLQVGCVRSGVGWRGTLSKQTTTSRSGRGSCSSPPRDGVGWFGGWGGQRPLHRSQLLPAWSINPLPRERVPSAPQVLLFSATLHSPEVRALAGKICQNPIIIDLKGKDAVPETGGWVPGTSFAGRWVPGTSCAMSRTGALFDDAACRSPFSFASRS